MTAVEQALLARVLTSAVERSRLRGSSGGLLGIDERAIDEFAEVLVRKRFAAVRHALVAHAGESAAVIAADFTAYARASRLPIRGDRHADERAFARWRKGRRYRAARSRLASYWRWFFAP